MATPAFPGKQQQSTNTQLDAIATTACSVDARHLGTKMLSAKGGVALTEPQLYIILRLGSQLLICKILAEFGEEGGTGWAEAR